MKKIILFAILGCLAAACETMPRSFHEFYYIDKEWGQAQMHTWDAMVLNPQPQMADAKPVGMDGLDAEEVMRVLHESYGEPPEQVDVLQMKFLGSGRGSSN